MIPAQGRIKRKRNAQRAILEKRTRCQQCNGAGEYMAAYPWRKVTCKTCSGTGRVIPF